MVMNICLVISHVRHRKIIDVAVGSESHIKTVIEIKNNY